MHLYLFVGLNEGDLIHINVHIYFISMKVIAVILMALLIRILGFQSHYELYHKN